jgi:hypothetical protein
METDSETWTIDEAKPREQTCAPSSIANASMAFGRQLSRNLASTCHQKNKQYREIKEYRDGQSQSV